MTKANVWLNKMVVFEKDAVTLGHASLTHDDLG